jgi:hypothetical protein
MAWNNPNFSLEASKETGRNCTVMMQALVRNMLLLALRGMITDGATAQTTRPSEGRYQGECEVLLVLDDGESLGESLPGIDT